MKVELLHATPLSVLVTAIRECWDSGNRSDSKVVHERIDSDSNIEFSFWKLGHKDKLLIENIIAKGHESVLEHISFSFRISGISRACSHQLVRHRMASYSQRSQRYVSESSCNVVIPESVKNNEEANDVFLNMLRNLKYSYNELVALGIPKEDARFVLPNACETSVVMTINTRSLRNFFKLRMDKHAQWEIRELAMEIYNQIPSEYRILFKDIAEVQND